MLHTCNGQQEVGFLQQGKIRQEGREICAHATPAQKQIKCREAAGDGGADKPSQ